MLRLRSVRTGKFLRAARFPRRRGPKHFFRPSCRRKLGNMALCTRGLRPRDQAPVNDELQERRAEVIKAAKDETKRRRLGIHGKKIE
jgi:hypothetical protein